MFLLFLRIRCGVAVDYQILDWNSEALAETVNGTGLLRHPLCFYNLL
jgi:hypothetical protein